MFGPGLAAFRVGDPADLEAASSTFVRLLPRIHRPPRPDDGASMMSSRPGTRSGRPCTATPRSNSSATSKLSASIPCAATARSSPECRSASATTPRPRVAHCRGPDDGPCAQIGPMPHQHNQRVGRRQLRHDAHRPHAPSARRGRSSPSAAMMPRLCVVAFSRQGHKGIGLVAVDAVGFGSPVFEGVVP
jgi:hypothetical protein